MASPAVIEVVPPQDGGAVLQDRLRELGHAILQAPAADQAKQIALMRRVEDEFSWLPTGRVVAVHYDDGTYITGADYVSVIEAARLKFGDTARGQLLMVGIPSMVGVWG
jgi:hypothetical protein